MIKVFVLLAHILFTNGDVVDLDRSTTFPTEAACTEFMKNDADEEIHMFYMDIKEVTFTCAASLTKDTSI